MMKLKVPKANPKRTVDWDVDNKSTKERHGQ